MLPISLEWLRDADGYRIETFGRYGKSIVRNGGELLPCRPLKDNEMLYAEFAGVKTPEELLKFVSRYGLLEDASGGIGGGNFAGNWGTDFRPVDEGFHGELTDEHLRAAKLIRDVLKAENQGNAASKRKAYAALAMQYAEMTDELAHVRVVPQSDGRGFQSVFEASSLMSAIWLQLSGRIGSGLLWDQCRYCHRWFEKGPGTSKRADSQFCSPSHKVAFHRKQAQGG